MFKQIILYLLNFEGGFLATLILVHGTRYPVNNALFLQTIAEPKTHLKSVVNDLACQTFLLVLYCLIIVVKLRGCKCNLRVLNFCILTKRSFYSFFRERVRDYS